MTDNELNECPMPDDIAEAVKRAREAAVKCIDAMQRLHEAALQQPGEQETLDYREHLVRLYGALRQGWEPILRCWPELATLAVTDKNAIDTERVSALATAWFGARCLFWGAVRELGHDTSAICAWKEWADTYEPDEELDFLNLDADAQRRALQTALLDGWPPEMSNAIISLIRLEMPSAGDVSVGETQVLPPPPFPFPFKPLPQKRPELERLQASFNKLIEAYRYSRAKLFIVAEMLHHDRELANRHGSTEINATFNTLSDADARFSPHLSPYLDPLDVAIHKRDHRIAHRNLGSVFGTGTEVVSEADSEAHVQRLVEAIRGIMETHCRYQEFLEQQRDCVESELEKLDSGAQAGQDPGPERLGENTATSEPASDQAVEAVTIDLGGQDYTVKAHTNGAEKVPLKGEFGIPPQYRKLFGCFVAKIFEGGASELVDGLKLNEAMTKDLDETVKEPLSQATRNALKKLRDLFFDHLGPPPGGEDWIITVRNQGTHLNGTVEWKVSERLKKSFTGGKPWVHYVDPSITEENTPADDCKLAVPPGANRRGTSRKSRDDE